MPSATLHAYLTSPLVVVGFVIAVWVVMSFFTSILTGWFKLALRFASQSEPYGEIKTAGPFPYTIYMRFWTHYGWVIRLRAASDALYASIVFPLRVGHPPLRIPWDEVRLSRTTRLLFPYVVLTLGAEEQIPMRIPERMARKLGILDRIPA